MAGLTNTDLKATNYYILYQLEVLRSEIEKKILDLNKELVQIAPFGQLQRQFDIRSEIATLGQRIISVDNTIFAVKSATNRL